MGFAIYFFEARVSPFVLLFYYPLGEPALPLDSQHEPSTLCASPGTAGPWLGSSSATPAPSSAPTGHHLVPFGGCHRHALGNAVCTPASKPAVLPRTSGRERRVS